jgi:hypothetical protein
VQLGGWQEPAKPEQKKAKPMRKKTFPAKMLPKQEPHSLAGLMAG